MIARDVHVLMGRVHDLVRFFNISAFMGQYTAAPGGSPALLQITNYANRGASDLATVWFSAKYRSARLWTMDSPAPQSLSKYPENSGIDVELPSIAAYAGVEVSMGGLA
jgi:hypothetical protein